MSGPVLVTLGNLANGAAEELFQAALSEALANIKDPNTDWNSRREIHLAIRIQSLDETRRSCKISVGCNTKLAGIRAVPSQIVIGSRDGHLIAAEPFRQEEMFPEPRTPIESEAVESEPVEA